MSIPEYKDDFWEELEKLEVIRADAQAAHDEALAKLWASRDSRDIAPAGVFDEYSKRSEEFSAAIKEFQDFS